MQHMGNSCTVTILSIIHTLLAQWVTIYMRKFFTIFEVTDSCWAVAVRQLLSTQSPFSLADFRIALDFAITVNWCFVSACSANSSAAAASESLSVCSFCFLLFSWSTSSANALFFWLLPSSSFCFFWSSRWQKHFCLAVAHDSWSAVCYEVNIQYTTNGAYEVTNQTLCYKRGGGQVFNKCLLYGTMRVHASCDWKKSRTSMT